MRENTRPNRLKRKILLTTLALLILFFGGSLNAAAFIISGTVLVWILISAAFLALGLYVVVKYILIAAAFLVKVVLWVLGNIISLFFAPFARWALTTLGDVLRANPQVYPLGTDVISNLIRLTLKILAPFYILLLVLTGAYIIYAAGQPMERAKAKAAFSKLLMSMFIVSISPVLFQVMLDIEEGIVTQVTDSMTREMSEYAINSVVSVFSNLIVFVFGSIFILLALLVVFARLFMVYFSAIIFPAALFLYFFDFTKKLGANMLRFILMWIGMPIVQSMILALTILTVSEVGAGFSDYLISSSILLAGLAGMLFISLMMVGILKWAGALAGAAGLMMMTSRGKNRRLRAIGGAGLLAAGEIMRNPWDPGNAFYATGATVSEMTAAGGGFGGSPHLFAAMGAEAKRAIPRMTRGAARAVSSIGGAYTQARDRAATSPNRDARILPQIDGVWAAAKRTASVFNPLRPYVGGFRAVGRAAATTGGEVYDAVKNEGYGPQKARSASSIVSSSAQRRRAGGGLLTNVPAGPVGTMIFGAKPSELVEGEPTDIEASWTDGYSETDREGTKTRDARGRKTTKNVNITDALKTEGQRFTKHGAAAGRHLDDAGALWGSGLRGAAFLSLVRAGGSLGMAFMPLSPLRYTTRQSGLWLSALSVYLLPEGVIRDIAVAAGDKLAGIGIRQTWRRTFDGREVKAAAARFEAEKKKAAEARRTAAEARRNGQAFGYFDDLADKHEARAGVELAAMRDKWEGINKNDSAHAGMLLTHMRQNNRLAYDALIPATRDESHSGFYGRALKAALDDYNTRRRAFGLRAVTMAELSSDEALRRRVLSGAIVSGAAFEYEDSKGKRKKMTVAEHLAQNAGLGEFEPTSMVPAADDAKMTKGIGGPISQNVSDPKKWKPAEFMPTKDADVAKKMRDGFRDGRDANAVWDSLSAAEQGLVDGGRSGFDRYFHLQQKRLDFLSRAVNVTDRGRVNVSERVALSAQERSMSGHFLRESDGSQVLFPEISSDGQWHMTWGELAAANRTAYLNAREAGGGVSRFLQGDARMDEQITVVTDKHGLVAVNPDTGRYIVKHFDTYVEFESQAEAQQYVDEKKKHSYAGGTGIAVEDLTEGWARKSQSEQDAYLSERGGQLAGESRLEAYSRLRTAELQNQSRRGALLAPIQVMELKQEGMSAEQINDMTYGVSEGWRKNISGASLGTDTDRGLAGVAERSYADTVSRGLMDGGTAAEVWRRMSDSEKHQFRTAEGAATDAEARAKLSAYRDKFNAERELRGYTGIIADVNHETNAQGGVNEYGQVVVNAVSRSFRHTTTVNRWRDASPLDRQGFRDQIAEERRQAAAEETEAAAEVDEAAAEAEWYLRGRGRASFDELSRGAKEYFIGRVRQQSGQPIDARGVLDRPSEHAEELRIVRRSWDLGVNVDFSRQESEDVLTFMAGHEAGHIKHLHETERVLGSSVGDPTSGQSVQEQRARARKFMDEDTGHVSAEHIADRHTLDTNGWGTEAEAQNRRGATIVAQTFVDDIRAQDADERRLAAVEAVLGGEGFSIAKSYTGGADAGTLAGVMGSDAGGHSRAFMDVALGATNPLEDEVLTETGSDGGRPEAPVLSTSQMKVAHWMGRLSDGGVTDASVAAQAILDSLSDQDKASMRAAMARESGRSLDSVSDGELEAALGHTYTLVNDYHSRVREAVSPGGTPGASRAHEGMVNEMLGWEAKSRESRDVVDNIVRFQQIVTDPSTLDDLSDEVERRRRYSPVLGERAYETTRILGEL